MRNHIIDIFTETNLSIDKTLIGEYVDFCLEHSCSSIKGETANHHILPQAKNLPFKIHSNSSFNIVTLTHKNHYISHYMLHKALDHFSTVSAYVAMHGKDCKLGRLDNITVSIYADQYNIAMRRRSIMHKHWAKTVPEGETLTNGQLISQRGMKTKKSRLYNGVPFAEWASQRMVGKKNIVYFEGVLDKIRETKLNTFVGDKNMNQVGAERAAETMSKKTIIGGVETTIYAQAGKKQSRTLAKKDANGVSLTDKYSAQRSIDRTKKGSRYIVKSVFSNFQLILYEKQVRQISPGLCSKTQNSYLGMSKYGECIFKKTNRTHLIGLYVVDTKDTPIIYSEGELKVLEQKFAS